MRREIIAVASLLLCAQTVFAQSGEEEEKGEPRPLRTEEEAIEPIGEMVVIDREEPYVPVGSRAVRDRDLLLRPHPRPADILRVVPGMFVNQHAGGGKANQYFLRGFDADHGTDVALSFDGVPLNLVSHGHGQGYTDLNWVIPEMVEHLDIMKGPYSARHGDFATAGALDMVSHQGVPRSYVSVGGGRFNTYRLLGVVGGSSQAGWQPLLAAETYTSDGPFVNEENYRRHNIYAKATRDFEDSTLSLAATSYLGGWHGSGQLPQRAVDSGMLDRFGAVDPTEGGNSSRHSAYVRLESYSGDSELRVLAYLVQMRLSLYSNFTFFSEDPVNGDQIEQTDDRVYAGVRGRYRSRLRWRDLHFDHTLGFDARRDAIANGLFTAVARERMGTVVDAEIDETSMGVFAQEDIRWTSWLRTVAGIRGDLFGFRVVDKLDDLSTPGVTGTGVRDQAIVSPKFTAVLSPLRKTDLFVNVGSGFHSNDARAVVRRPRRGTPLARAVGYELGFRTDLLDRLDVAGSMWQLELDNEIVWVGDAGTTEARGPTTRTGVELETRARLLPWLYTDLDLTFSRARFDDLPLGADRVPLAPRFTLTGGVSIDHPSGAYGRLGVRSLSDRPLTEDNFLVAEGFTLIDLTAGYRHRRFELILAADNVLDTSWAEAQFATTSRLPGDPPTDRPPPPYACPDGTRVGTDDSGNFLGCEDVHFSPGYPLNISATLRLYF